MTLFFPIEDYFTEFPKKSEPLRWIWYYEIHNPYELHGHAIREIIVSKRTKYQYVDIVDTYLWGKMLVLNGEPQSAEFDEAVYHEALVLPAMIAHPSPKRVLIIGGGEGGTLREVLRHRDVQEVIMVDIDEELIEISKRYLKEWSQGAFDDPRVKLIFGDAREILKKLEGKFDVIISDLSEPSASSPAHNIFNDEFLNSIDARLDEKGIFVTQASDIKDILTDEDAYHNVIRRLLQKRFKWVQSYSAFINSFFTEWTFIVASDHYDVKGMSDVDKRIEEKLVRKPVHYDQEAHRKFFSFLRSLRERLNQ